MKLDRIEAQGKMAVLREFERRERNKASGLPEGDDRDAAVMAAERLADEAAHIDEQEPGSVEGSGLWR